MHSGSDDKPRVRCLSRRHFLLLSGGLVGGVGAVAAPGKAKVAQSGSDGPANPPVVLTEKPSANPGFLVRGLPNGDLLAWSRDPEKGIRAYRMNQYGKRIWGLCDGNRTLEEIGLQYERVTGRSEHEGELFVRALLRIGVIVMGATVVARGRFPQVPNGGCYRYMLSPEPTPKD